MALTKTAFEALPLGSIKPVGWLRDQLRIQADGFTGHLDEQWADVGPNNGWVGGKGESWERGPYYLDGLLPLAYLLEDERLIAKANRWVEWALASQRENGFFGPVGDEVGLAQDWWHYIIMLKVLVQHAEATGDERVEPFMLKFFHYVRANVEQIPLTGWAQARGTDLLLCILWLHKRQEDSMLLELADMIAEQSTEWSELFHDFPYWRKVEAWDMRTHVVNVAMGLKMPGVIYEMTGESYHRDAVDRGIAGLMTHHGQAHGMFSGDEWLSGTHPSQGVELCAVVEYMFTMEQLTRIFGDGQYGDILEKVAFNALPATISKDWTSHQYDQQVNQIICNVAPRNWSNGPDANVFGLEPNFGCCTANMHQGWPKFTSHLWMSDGASGLAVVSYAPCTVKTLVAGGVTAQVEVSGDYPFRDQVNIALKLEGVGSQRFAISFRIPGWCEAPVLRVNGEETVLKPVHGYVRVEREWKDGDVISLALPMEVRTASRNLYAINVERGPLVYALPIQESWQLLNEREMFHDWEIYPASPWKYGLLAEQAYEVELADVAYQPFDAAQTPVKIKARGHLVRDWKMEANSAGTAPLSSGSLGPEVGLELVPYGGAKLRIGEFPLLGKKRSARLKG